MTLITFSGLAPPWSLASLDANFAAIAAQFLANRAYAEYSANADLGVIPSDDTPPQIGEGTQIMSVSFTLRSALSRVRFRFQAHGSTNIDGAIAAALFQDSGPSALSAAFHNTKSTEIRPIALEYEYAPGSVGPFTYTIRAGGNGGTVGRLNGLATTRHLGGALIATLVVEEVWLG